MRVGTSPIDSRGNAFIEDHPHACGDKQNYRRAKQTAEGSSPCVWGQVAKAELVTIYGRIIPMRVGTRCRNTGSFHREQDHPHACGDKGYKLLTSAVTPGSSPCVWGQAG